MGSRAIYALATILPHTSVCWMQPADIGCHAVPFYVLPMFSWLRISNKGVCCWLSLQGGPQQVVLMVQQQAAAAA